MSDSLSASNEQIASVKEKAAAANVAAIEADLNRVKAIKERFSPAVAPLCDDYRQEKQDKVATEVLRDAARDALNQYRDNVFPAYENSINDYLQRFNAGFRLDSVNSVNTRTGSSCNYSVLINQVPVPLSAQGDNEASFRNTLSAGDRNALALAFFFASLEQDPNRGQKTVVIDDPMTSLDEHRSLTTVQEMRRLVNDVEQVIVLSHSKPFLCALWDEADTATRTASKIVRANVGSTFTAWDVNQDCITGHDRRHAMISEYIENSVGADERVVAAALRPILEVFLRVAYPQWFSPGTMLGRFIALCQQREGTNDEIMSPGDRAELSSLRRYANKFHHDTNTAWQTTVINDQQLLDFSQRTHSTRLFS